MDKPPAREPATLPKEAVTWGLSVFYLVYPLKVVMNLKESVNKRRSTGGGKHQQHAHEGENQQDRDHPPGLIFGDENPEFSS